MVEHSRAEVLFAQGGRSDEGGVCFPLVAGTCRYLVDSPPIYLACECLGYLGSIQECFLGGHYIPPGLMAISHTEFMKLTQGTKSLNEYLQAFNNLSRYATEFMDTDAKKIASFKRGLSPKLMKTLGNNKCATFNKFVSDP
jgi:hypothetical protein